MHNTKSEILALLKRNDGASVDEISCALELAAMTVRQHLTALERDGLVRADEVRRPTGRPHYRYKLTPEGHRGLAHGCDRLLALLIEESGLTEPAELGGSPEDRRRQLLRRAARSLAERHGREVQGLESRAFVEGVAGLLRNYGGFVEWHDLGSGRFELRDFSCVFRTEVAADGPCEWHETFLSAVTGAPVVAAIEPADCAACCRYVLVAPVAPKTWLAV